MAYNVKNATEGTLADKVSQSVINALVHAKPVKEILKSVFLVYLDFMLEINHAFNAIWDAKLA